MTDSRPVSRSRFAATRSTASITSKARSRFTSYSPPLFVHRALRAGRRRAAAGAGHTRGDLATEPRARRGPSAGVVQQS